MLTSIKNKGIGIGFANDDNSDMISGLLRLDSRTTGFQNLGV